MTSITDIVSPADIDSAMADIQAGAPFQSKKFFSKIHLDKKSPDEIKKVFNMLDINKSGYMEKSDVSLVLKFFKRFVRYLTVDEITDFYEAGDPNHTGKIGPDDSVAMVKSSKH